MKPVVSKICLSVLALSLGACGLAPEAANDRRSISSSQVGAAETAAETEGLALTSQAESRKEELKEKLEEIKGELKEIIEADTRAYCGLDEEEPINSEILIKCGLAKAADASYPDAHKVGVAGWASYTAYQNPMTKPYGDRRAKITAGLTNSPDGYEVSYYAGGFHDSAEPLSTDFTMTLAGGVVAVDSNGQVQSAKGIGVLAFHVDGIAMAYLRSGRNPDNNYVCMSVLYVSNACMTETEWKNL